MKVHVLSGDSLVKPFAETGLEGEVAVCRECFVDGNLEGADLGEFWKTREKFLTDDKGEEAQDYTERVVDEFVRLWNLSDGNEVILWFEYELFCQVNLWFTVWLLRNTDARFSIAYPYLKNESDIWKGFSFLDTEELKKSYENRVKLNHDDVFLAVGLWESFQKGDLETLRSLAEQKTESFPTLEKIVDAACSLGTRPKEIVRQIIADGDTEFGPVFQQFCKDEPIYGFGDLQVKRIFDEVVLELES